MKKLVLLSLLILSACANEVREKPATEQSELSINVSQAVKTATDKSDYRLMYTLGRKSVIPGFETSSFEKLKNQCGVKPAKGTSDVMKTTKDKQDRKVKYQFAKQFNLKMHQICLKNKT